MVASDAREALYPKRATIQDRMEQYELTQRPLLHARHLPGLVRAAALRQPDLRRGTDIQQ
jgi:hypothetical protein